MRITFIGLAASDCKSLPDEYQRELIAARVTTFLLFGRYTPEQFRPDEPARDRKTHDLWYEPAARPKW
jgi:hypothetical protein